MTQQEESAAKHLMELAHEVARNSYSPYSRFKVGAALALSNGEIVTGTNVENVSYGLTICAERAALLQAVSRFGPAIRVRAIAVANLNDAASPPCGACRQVLAEFGECVVICADSRNTRHLHIHLLSELLPHSFKL